MEIENTTFGTITMDGKTYEHDVVVRLTGEVVKRKKKLSKKYYGTKHTLRTEDGPPLRGRGRCFANLRRARRCSHAVSAIAGWAGPSPSNGAGHRPSAPGARTA